MGKICDFAENSFERNYTFFFGKTSDVDYKAVSIVVMELGMLATIYV